MMNYGTYIPPLRTRYKVGQYAPSRWLIYKIKEIKMQTNSTLQNTVLVPALPVLFFSNFKAKTLEKKRRSPIGSKSFREL